MRVPQKLFFRFGTLLSVALLSQCCCCIIPLPAYGGDATPLVVQLLDPLQTLLSSHPFLADLTASVLYRPVGAFFLP